MNSNSQSANTEELPSQRLADFVGTAIAVLTLTLPMFVIGHYSSSSVLDNRQPSTYSLQTTDNDTKLIKSEISSIYKMNKHASGFSKKK
ncbi:MAG: hypothetical protein VKN72_22755 [Nostocales cyanobacterium 94392]|nr:hypothetical protein [Nostocales cyanobacterium 94392]